MLYSTKNVLSSIRFVTPHLHFRSSMTKRKLSTANKLPLKQEYLFQVILARSLQRMYIVLRFRNSKGISCSLFPLSMPQVVSNVDCRGRLGHFCPHLLCRNVWTTISISTKFRQRLYHLMSILYKYGYSTYSAQLNITRISLCYVITFEKNIQILIIFSCHEQFAQRNIGL